MASASTSLGISISLHCTTSHRKTLFLGHPRTTLANPIMPRHPSLLTFSRRRRNTSAPSPISFNKKKPSPKEDEEDGDIDEDAFDALFNMLEEDLKNDGLGDGEDDDMTEEEMLQLENELAGALADDQLSGALPSTAGGETDNNGDKEEDENEVKGADDEQEEKMPLKLKTWQLKKLAYALKLGRRKTSIKNLAADVCLDRAVVLKLLREPPPSLVMMSATLPDQPVPTMLVPLKETDTTIPVDASPVEPIHKAKPEMKEKLPIHVMQKSWSSQKRLKKAHLETLEQVYRRTKRPTNAMLSSIVYVTNLPRKKIIKWFEDKRAEDGIPDAQVPRVPYRRFPSESVFTR